MPAARPAALGIALLLTPTASADWRSDADARIAEHRMSDLTVRVVDANGDAVPGATVGVQQTEHAFGWGTAINAGRWTSSSTDPRYRENTFKYFNRATLESGHKMKPWEDFSYRAKSIQTVEDLLAGGLNVRGHAAVWQKSGSPDDLLALTDPDAISARVNAHIAAVTGYVYANGALDEWDVVNENYAEHNLVDKFVAADGGGSLAFETHPVLKGWLDQANAHYAGGPGVKTYINDYHILARDNDQNREHRASFLRTAAGLLSQGADLDGVGFQGHFGNGYTSSPDHARISPEQQLERMQAFADLGLEMAVTEFDMYGDGWTTQEKVDYMDQFVRLAFAQEEMQHFTMWGFWDGQHWKGEAPLFDDDFNLKPEGLAFVDMVYNEWWTSGAGVTGDDGLFTLAAFKGDHELSVAFDGLSQTALATLGADGTFTVTLPGVVPEPASAALLLAGLAGLCLRRREVG